MRRMFPLMMAAVMLGVIGCVHPAVMNPGSGRITLADQGKSDYVILLAADHSPAEQHAAGELSRFLKEVTGAELAIVAPAKRGRHPAIAVGPGAARSLVPELNLAGLGQEGILIQRYAPHLILTGGPGAPRGTLYAVYTFLEDIVGCRWWTKEESSIPHHTTLAIPECRQRYVPTFEYREPLWFGAFEPDWAVRNKCNGGSHGLDEARGGTGIRYAGGGGHTFNSLVPPAEFFPRHPEWFSEIDGKRVAPPTPAQWCLTNPELLTFCIQRVKTLLRDAPPDSIVSVSQNDGDGTTRCQCAKCLAVEQEEGSPSGPVLRFVNAVADGIKNEYPRASIQTFAYQYSRKPPRVTRPRPNVIVQLCSIECSFLQPLDNEVNRAFAEDLAGWAAIGTRIYLWDYGMEYLVPYPNLRVLGPNFRFFANHRVKGIFFEGNYTSSGTGFGGLQAWLQAKLMWNPATDERVLIRQFVEGYYGPAAPIISEYLRLLHDTAEKTNYHLSFAAPVTAPYLTLDFLTRAEALFQKAEIAVNDSPALLRRVRLAHAAIQYVVLSRWPTLRREAQANGQPWPFGAAGEQMARFLDVCRVNRVAMLMENNQATPEWFRTRLDLTTGPRTGVAAPALCKGLPDTDWVDFQEDKFPVGQPYGEIRPDPSASNGRANWMSSMHLEWATQLYLPISLWMNNVDQEWKAYIVVRVEKKGKGEGSAFSYGMYDLEQSKAVGAGGTVMLSDLADDSYRVYEVGTTGLSYARYIWVAPTKNPDNVSGVWVDRIFMVRTPGKP